MKRDGFAQRIEASLNELTAVDDRSFVFRLKKPFPAAGARPRQAHRQCLLHHAGADRAGPIPTSRSTNTSAPAPTCSIATNGRLARSRPSRASTPTCRGRNRRASSPAASRPISTASSGTSSPTPRHRRQRSRRARRNGGRRPTVDLLPLLRKARGVVVERLDDFGVVGVMRFNMLHPPFDNVKLRRAILPAINQADFMNAAMGGDPELTRIGRRRLHPRLAARQHSRPGGADRPARPGLAKKLVSESGYKGEKSRVPRALRLPSTERGVPRRQRHADEARAERRLPGHGLGHDDPTPQQQGHHRQRRLERVLHRLGGTESGRSGLPLPDIR